MHTLIKIGLGLSLAIVFPFMVAFGIEAFYPPPQQAYESCLTPIKIRTSPPEQQVVSPKADATYQRCINEAESQTNMYNRNLFLLTTAFGFVAIVLGTLLFSEKLGPVGPGLVFGGLFTILYGTTRSFRSLDKQWIFIELLAVFIGIILVTWRYLKTIKKK